MRVPPSALGSPSPTRDLFGGGHTVRWSGDLHGLWMGESWGISAPDPRPSRRPHHRPHATSGHSRRPGTSATLNGLPVVTGSTLKLAVHDRGADRRLGPAARPDCNQSAADDRRRSERTVSRRDYPIRVRASPRAVDQARRNSAVGTLIHVAARCPTSTCPTASPAVAMYSSCRSLVRKRETRRPLNSRRSGGLLVGPRSSRQGDRLTGAPPCGR